MLRVDERLVEPAALDDAAHLGEECRAHDPKAVAHGIKRFVALDVEAVRPAADDVDPHVHLPDEA